MLHISFSTDDLTAEDRKVLALLGGDVAVSPSVTVVTADPEKVAAEVAKPAPKAPKAKPAPKAEPEPEPEPETPAEEPEADEDLLGGEAQPEADAPTMADAVAAATKLVSSGGAPKVKGALASVGAKRVSEIPEDQIAAFLAALA